jgi:hypothetical protein
MSTSDHILFRTGLAPTEAAQRIAETLGLELSPGRRPGTQVVGGRIPNDTLYSGGWVSDNYLATPDEPSILAHYDVMWAIRAPGRAEEVVHAESLRLFHLVTVNLPWHALLYRDLAWLVAVWSPTNGRHDFPANVSADAEDQHIWEPYIPTRW